MPLLLTKFFKAFENLMKYACSIIRNMPIIYTHGHICKICVFTKMLNIFNIYVKNAHISFQGYVCKSPTVVLLDFSQGPKNPRLRTFSC